jgi:hypothetical protein
MMATTAPMPKNKNSACEAFATEESTVTVALLAPRETWRLPAQLSGASVGANCGAWDSSGLLAVPSSLHGALFIVAGFNGVLSVYENFCPMAGEGGDAA